MSAADEPDARATPDPQPGPQDTPLPLGAPLWNAADAVRFTDSQGTTWRVVERETAHVPGARGARCLIFLLEGVVRRAWAYPPGWLTLPPAALEALGLGE